MSFSTSDTTMYAKVMEVTGLTVRCPRGKALYAENIRLTDAEFEGTVLLSYTEADIRSIKTWFPGKALYAQNGTHARVRLMEGNLSNPDYPYNEDPLVFSTYDNYGSVFVDESNASLSPMTTTSSKAQHIYQGIGCNSEGADGHFAFRCANGLCDTWSVRRTGGGTAACGDDGAGAASVQRNAAHAHHDRAAHPAGAHRLQVLRFARRAVQAVRSFGDGQGQGVLLDAARTMGGRFLFDVGQRQRPHAARP